MSGLFQELESLRPQTKVLSDESGYYARLLYCLEKLLQALTQALPFTWLFM